MDPKTFYNQAMPQKYGDDYEAARWRANPFLSAQYDMMRSVMAWVAPLARGKRVLEVGPGPGTWTKFLLRSNPAGRFTLVDISSEMLRQAKESLSGAPIEFVESGLLEYRGAPAEFFFSSRAIEYIDDKQAMAETIASLLVAGGRGVIITKMPKPLFDRLRGRRAELHTGQISPGTLASCLRAAGLVVGRVRIATATVALFNSPRLNAAMFALLSRVPLVWPLTFFAESYVLEFTKP